METEINYFSNCTNEELKVIWNNRDKFYFCEEDNPIRPYLEKYYSTKSVLPAVLCETDFYRECTKRFIMSIYSTEYIEINQKDDKNEVVIDKPYGFKFAKEAYDGVYASMKNLC